MDSPYFWVGGSDPKKDLKIINHAFLGKDNEYGVTRSIFHIAHMKENADNKNSFDIENLLLGYP